jgi:NitT/TauT family transport system permease protein
MSSWPYIALALALGILIGGRRLEDGVARYLLPIGVIIGIFGAWDIIVARTESSAFPAPAQVFRGFEELVASKRLWGDITASLFRVTWGYFIAAAVGIPMGLVAGWYTRAFMALNPVIQGLRPISPIAWIPIAILWFGIGDMAGIYLIFYASFFPITVGTMAAVRNISLVHQRSASNFGLKGFRLFRLVILPAALPQIITSLRITLGVSWLVIVAAEMVGMESGLGYLINDARNMGSRYDLVVATMIMIGVIGIVLDLLIRQLEKFEQVRWGIVKQ